MVAKHTGLKTVALKAVPASSRDLIALLGCGEQEPTLHSNQESDYLKTSEYKKSPVPILVQGFRVLMPGNDLLSHGETPHYHRRNSISLLSSGWDQVGLERYGCQANWLRLMTIKSRKSKFENCNKVNVASV